VCWPVSQCPRVLQTDWPAEGLTRDPGNPVWAAPTLTIGEPRPVTYTLGQQAL
jgi:hypothetical protein